MQKFSYDFNYEMQDFWGNVIRIYGNDDGPAYVEAPDHFREPHEFRSEKEAYAWAWRRGYRD